MPLGVRDDGDEPDVDELQQHLVRVREEPDIRKLDEQVVPVIDCVLLRMFEGIVDGVGLQMEIATTMKAHRAACAQLGNARVDQRRIEPVPAVGVWCGHEIDRPRSRGQLEHRPAIGQILGAVVEAVEDVAVDVDEHVSRLSGRLSLFVLVGLSAL